MAKIIIDASYLTAVSRDGQQLGKLVEDGYSLVITDALLYELSCTGDTCRGVAALQKLRSFVAKAEVWEHAGVMLSHELSCRQPYGCPCSPELTQGLGAVLEAGITRSGEWLGTSENVRRQRECDTLDVILHNFPTLERYACGLRPRIQGKPYKSSDVQQCCREIVNSDEVIRSLVPPSVRESVDDSWVAWHMARVQLALFCDYVRMGTTSIACITGKARIRWANRKHDLDYLICLAWADAIASNETSGEMNAYRDWMYGDTKPMLSVLKSHGA